MNKFTCSLALQVLAFGLVAPGARSSVTAGMKEGNPAFKSMSQLAFGPEGVLFIADTKSAAVVAIATGDTRPAAGNATIKVEGINQKLAALLGTSVEQILIADLAVNPISRQAYLTVSRGRGPDAVPVLVRVKTDGALELVSLDKVRHARAELPDPPVDGMVKQGKRESNPRLESITDIAYTDGRLFVAGLSQPGAKIQGKTIAEFGNRNRPLDMIVYQKGGKDYLLLANESRGVMKIAAEQIRGAPAITEHVSDTKGLAFEKVDWAGVSQLDRFDARYAIVVRTGAAGAMNLETLALP